MILTGDRVIEAFPAGAMTLRLWWAIPGVLAGTSMPLLHRERHDYRKSALDAYRDDLPLLYRAGIRAIVCLLDFPSLAQIYSSAGFAVHMMPVADGDVPTPEQFAGFLQFVDHQRSIGHPVVVHCVAGRGRTGTALAAYLIATGYSVESAIARLRAICPGAIESPRQLRFLHDLPHALARWNEVRGKSLQAIANAVCRAEHEQ